MTHLLNIVLLDGFLNNLVTWIMLHGGFFFLLFVVFAETGLFVGFFLPGDSLLIAAGIYLKQQPENFYNIHYSLVVILLIVASVLGNMVGYWFGRKTGPVLYHRKESWYFKKKHLEKAHDFYEQYGKGTIFLAKFLPIIRTFAPIVAGVVEMKRATFIFYNIVGSVVWVSLMVLGGYFLEAWVKQRFGFSLTQYIDVIAIVIVLITTLPILYKLFFSKKKVVPANDNDNSAVL